MDSWFIDKLNVHQEHSQRLPIVGEEMVFRIDLKTGEPISESPSSIIDEGSFSTKLTIRCNGTRVSVKGNPSRWNRSENLFGFASLDDCIRVYNQVLLRFGLPPFTKCTQVKYTQAEEGGKNIQVSDGAIISHIDFTRNFSVGKGNEAAFLRGLSTISWGTGKNKMPILHPTGTSVTCYKGKSGTTYEKVYNKAHELKGKRAKNLATASEEEISYYDRVINWCEENGILREEYSFKRVWLKRKGLCFYGLIDEKYFKEHLQNIEKAMKKLEVANTQYESISDQLLVENIVASRQAANSTQMVYLQWLNGMHIDKEKRQYWVHKKRLIEVGVDISMPHDVSRSPLRIRSNDLVDVKNVVPPSWYQMPDATPNLALVS